MFYDSIHTAHIIQISVNIAPIPKIFCARQGLYHQRQYITETLYSEVPEKYRFL